MSTFDKNGWMKGPHGELLFWVQEHLRHGLHRPGNTVVIAAQSVKLDITHFVHGIFWHKCHDPITDDD
ncbi:hypothetical protein B0H21DRAFT_475429 [Amylocystis lapponica]|nr:hypothetical protein B0H21DRAFT_475429 [Amylocystis lapponica]